MLKPVKVYNKGIRPIVYHRDRKRVDAIHPGKFLEFDEGKAKNIIDIYENACSEADYEKHLKEMAKKQEDDQKETTSKAKKETKATGGK